MAEHTSCTYPGSVNSADRAPPPIAGCASSTTTLRCFRAIVIAAANPFGPDPITIASYFLPANRSRMLEFVIRQRSIDAQPRIWQNDSLPAAQELPPAESYLSTNTFSKIQNAQARFAIADPGR